MIACAQAKERIARGVSGNASAEEAAELRAHTTSCAACAAELDRARRIWALMGRLPALQPSRPVLASRLQRRRSLPLWAAGVAAAAVLAAVAALWPRSSAPSATPEAPVVDRTPPRTEPEPVASPEQNRTERALDQAVKDALREKAVTPETPVLVTPLPAPSVPPAPLAAPAPKPEAPQPKDLETAKPAPEPAPAPVPAAPSRDTLPLAARVDRVQGEVVALIGGQRTPVSAAFRLTGGDGLATVGKNSQAVLAYEDGTRVALGEDTVVSQVLDRRTPSDPKRIHIQQGVVAAQAPRQAGGESLVFVTPTAEARVLGTRLTLLVTPASTRLEVKEGRVKLMRREDEAAVEVGPDHYALAAKGTALVARAIPGPKGMAREDFERGRWSAAWILQAEPGQGLKVAVQSGALLFALGKTADSDVRSGSLPNDPGPLKKTFDQVQRISALASKKDWPRAAALESKLAYPFGNETPLRIRINAWHSQGDVDRLVWLGLNRGLPGQGLSLERRGDRLQLVLDGAAAPLWSQELACVRDWESLELWLTKDQIAVRRNGLTVAVEANPMKAKAVQVSVGVCAKAELAQDEETRVDDLDVAGLTKADFEQISR
jgi:ferric-dicitrate binding protein FerR (iron transport regulator)